LSNEYDGRRTEKWIIGGTAALEIFGDMLGSILFVKGGTILAHIAVAPFVSRSGVR
jgi:hypothetical protein